MTVLVVSAAAFLASLDLFIVNIAFPDIRRAFGAADLGAMSWTSTPTPSCSRRS